VNSLVVPYKLSKLDKLFKTSIFATFPETEKVGLVLLPKMNTNKQVSEVTVKVTSSKFEDKGIEMKLEFSNLRFDTSSEIVAVSEFVGDR
jgi:hypothetical protein